VPPPSLLAIIISDLRSHKNLDVYVAILINLALGICALFGLLRIDILAAAILVMVWTALANRHQLSKAVTSINQNREGSVIKFTDFPDPNIRGRLRGAGEISLSGLSFLRLFPVWGDDIEYAVGQGATLKVIVADPDSSVPDMSSFRSTVYTPEQIREHIVTAIAYIKQLRKKLPDSNIELKKYPYLAPYALAILQPKGRTSLPYYHARLLPFRSSSLLAPAIMPQPNDRLWVEFIEAQFSSMWTASETVDLDAAAASGSH
jgi:hypothetical protein